MSVISGTKCLIPMHIDLEGMHRDLKYSHQKESNIEKQIF